MMLSSKQQAMFWALWAKAEREELPVSATRQERDVARRGVMFRACGRITLKDVNPTGDFDRLMFAVASLAGDYDGMGYWGNAAERRTAHLIGECARQIGEIVGDPKGWEYCQKVFVQAGLPASWMDIPDGLLFATFEMMDTHRRRMLKRDHGWTGERNGTPLGFSPARIYIRRGVAVDYYDPLPVADPDVQPARFAASA
jgi:hypothetical protein